MENKAATPVSKRKHIRTFFTLTFIFSWLVWGAIILFNPSDDLILPLIFLGAFGPTFVAIYLVQRHGSSAEKRDFWKRVISFRRIGWKWYFFIFLIFPAILFLGYPVYSLLGGEVPKADTFTGGVETPADFIFLLVIMLLGGPLAEELGWRGYALDPLQQKWGPVKASILLGIIWVAWHLPLFFIEGTSQHAKGFGVAFWSWSFQIIAISIIFTWVYNNTKRSILSAVLLHLMANIAYPTNLDPTGEAVFTGVRLLVVLAIVVPWLQKPSSEKQLMETITAGNSQPDIPLADAAIRNS